MGTWECIILVYFCECLKFPTIKIFNLKFYFQIYANYPCYMIHYVVLIHNNLSYSTDYKLYLYEFINLFAKSLISSNCNIISHRDYKNKKLMLNLWHSQKFYIWNTKEWFNFCNRIIKNWSMIKNTYRTKPLSSEQFWNEEKQCLIHYNIQ